MEILILLALLVLLPFGIYRWHRSEDDEENSITADDYEHYHHLYSTDSSEDYTSSGDDMFSSTSFYYDDDTEDSFSAHTDTLTDPSYCFLDYNIYHDTCYGDDDWSSYDDLWDDWDTWDDD